MNAHARTGAAVLQHLRRGIQRERSRTHAFTFDLPSCSTSAFPYFPCNAVGFASGFCCRLTLRFSNSLVVKESYAANGSGVLSVETPLVTNQVID